MPARFFALLVLVAVTLTACKDGLVEPERFGTVQGIVQDFETGAPIVGASITTSPATSSITTNQDGGFSFDDIMTGSYTISASRNGYDSGTTTVSVREDRVTQATVFLRPDTDGGPDVLFGAEVLNFTNETFTADSSFVTVEYRALNNGNDVVDAYEVYFRIDTDRGPFYQEIGGTDLGAGEQDVGSFRKRLLGAVAQVVVVEDTNIDVEETTTGGTTR
ncbi:carboxypeptidase-like regulatory domain-containing protein [Rubrivirga marina]|uniref:Carboxypeptidase regulatory-like domain-containing protein n=1 Tax=Rubrivirga marina TaxID=1196024 RepID=A0A271J2F5_9BACT|nr:carboxypeptidase-like regulatory domain-containing protein [Rubrivirga marina]PAP77448.1 hypothetical protein BSZ37_13885 [Rubrivirga marina]